MGDGGAFHPQCNRAFAGGAGFDVVDDQRGLRVVIDEQLCFVPVDLDFDVDPFGRADVDVGFVFGRSLLAEFEPGEVGVLDVLGGVIAALLVIGSAVGGAEVEAIVGFAIGLDAEGDTDKTTCAAGGAGAWFPGEIDFDGAVGELDAVEERKVILAIGIGASGSAAALLESAFGGWSRAFGAGRRGKLNGFLPLEGGWGGDDIVQCKPVGGAECEGFRLWISGGEDRREHGERKHEAHSE